MTNFIMNGVLWHIVYVPANSYVLQRSDGFYTAGVCDNYTHIIYICENLEPLFLKKVLCHEITHAAMFSYNIILTIEQEELLADLLATYGEEIIEQTIEIFNRLYI